MSNISKVWTIRHCLNAMQMYNLFVHFFFLTNISYYIQFDHMNRPLGRFLFSVYSILLMNCNLRRLRFLFSPCFSPCTSFTYARVSCQDRLFVVSGKGSFGLLRTKKVGAASRLDDNLHTSISLQVVFSP